MRRTLLPLCTLTALGTLLLGAQSPPPVTAPASKPAASPCAAPERRQFDFWVGSWTVKDPQGNPSGTSEITRDAAGCAILEHWSGAGGAPGISLNYYDPATGRWHQHWVGGGGLVAHLEGAFKDGVMTMTGERRDAQGAFTTRLRWTPQPDGGGASGVGPVPGRRQDLAGPICRAVPESRQDVGGGLLRYLEPFRLSPVANMR